MKTIALLYLILLTTIIGCTQLGSIVNGPAGPQPSVCDTQRPAEFANSSSYICEVAKKANMTPEAIDGLLLDATAMAFVTDAIKIKDIGDFLSKARQYLKPQDKCAGVSFNAFIEFLDMEAAKSQVLMSVLSRRIYIFKSTQIISDFDCWMINKSIQHQADQFGLKVVKL